MMANIKFLCLCLMVVLVTSSQGQKLKKVPELEKTTRIAGGDIITIDKAPHIVQLRHEKKGFLCGGTLIGDRFVVTAAHCFDGENYQLFTVVGGASTLSETGVQRKIADAYISAEYDEVTNDSDVAVLKLDGDMKGKNIKVMPLCTQTLKTGDFLQVSGWGLTKEGGERSENLRTVRVPIIDHKLCKDLHMKGEITDNMMCAAEKGKDSCTADSGGPAIFRGELCGIVSWGIGCARESNPGIYTRVNEVRWFIDQVLEM